MVVICVALHPSGLPPEQAAKASFLRVKQKPKWWQIKKVVKNLKGQVPSENCLRLAVCGMERKGKAAVQH